MIATNTVVPDYADIFNQRADDYHAAMRALPFARENEFTTLFSEIALSGQESIIDIPSGGGYLQNYIHAGCAVQSFDFSSGFAHEGGDHIQRIDANAKSWPIGRAQRVVSLAGLHHFDDPVQVIERLYSHVEPGGVLHVADVAADSAAGEFLNGFVDRHNVQGHHGNFLPVARQAWPSHWDISRLREEAIPWVFPDLEAMTWFCCKLFGVPLRHAQAMQTELGKTIGYSLTETGCQLHWSLLYLDVQVPGTRQ